MHAKITTAAICALLTLKATSAMGQTLTTLANFDGTNGTYPVAGVVADSSGDLFGTTLLGGSGSEGTVFELPAGSSTISALVNFNTSGGEEPRAGLLIDGTGNLYGTTSTGSRNGGTFFKVAAGTNTLNTLVTFTGTNGVYPWSGVIAQPGALYGTTKSGSTNGSIFKYNTTTNAVSTLATLGTAGTNPEGNLVADAQGNLYGTTEQGGANDDGIVFEIAAGTSTVTPLVTFTMSLGFGPVGDLIIDSAGNLYGTTSEGGMIGGAAGTGTVFKVAAGTHALTTLATFSQSTGADLQGGVIMDAAGNLFGTAESGGADSDGTVFEIAAGTDALTTVASFSGATGSGLYGDLFADSSGNLYGTTSGGGTDGDGTIFEITNSGYVVGAVPEPTSLSLLAVSGLALLRRRRRSS